MKNQIIKTTMLGLVTAALVALPTVSRAQDETKTNAPAHHHAAPKSLPFHGKAAAVDTAAMTLTVGTNILNVTSETRIFKDSKPATLSDIKVGEMVNGAYKKDEAGKNSASMIRVGGPVEKRKKAEEAVTPPAPPAPPAAPKN